MMREIASIVAAVDVPVNADIEAGYGSLASSLPASTATAEAST
jgi:2-methylisocitrate lyase-like PEP mutase family enzyme